MTTVQFRVKNLVLFINYGNKKQNACFPPNLPGISTPKYQKWCPKANNSTAPQNHRGKENDRFCLQYCIIACQPVISMCHASNSEVITTWSGFRI